MLKQLRQKKTMKRILWGLAIIIIPAFVLWGAGGLRESKNYAGTLFGKDVPFTEYQDNFNAAKNRALMTYGQSFYKMQDTIDVKQLAWDRMILLKEARRNKIKTSDDEVREAIRSFPFFKDKEGAFDQRVYEMILNNAFRTPPRRFEEEIREGVMIEQLIEGVMQNAPEPTDEEIEEALKKDAEKKETQKKAAEEKAKEEKKGKKEKEEGKEKPEEPEETPEEARQRIKDGLAMEKRFNAHDNWRKELYERAGLVSNLQKPEEEEPQEPEGPPQPKVTIKPPEKQDPPKQLEK